MKQATLPELENYVGGAFASPTGVQGQQICDANTGKPLQLQIGAGLDQVEAALAAADHCYRETDWERDVERRIAVLEQTAEGLSRPDIAEQIAQIDSLTCGVVIGATRKLASMLPILFKHAAHLLREGRLREIHPGPLGDITYFRRAWGPALLISPWNGPTPIGAHKLASAIAAGAPALVKPSVWTPHSALIITRLLHEAGIPEGAVNLVMGDRNAVRPLLNDARIKAVSFTGGLGGGRAVAAACANEFKPMQLELGGNNAFVVLEGADLDVAAEAITFALCNLNGQWCRALGRIFVHKPLEAQLLDKVLARLAEVRLGSSLDENSQMGPQAHHKQFEDVNRAIEILQHEGGTAHAVTPLPDLGGYFVAPTIITGCDPADTRDENFGPVAVWHTFETEGEALRLANDAPFGLSGAVFGPEEVALKFAAEMRTGGVKVNGYSLLALKGDLPRGAWELSGIGEEGGWESLQFFTGSRVIGVSPQDRLGFGA